MSPACGIGGPSRDRIGLVGCVKRKQGVPAPARDLYTSALFRGRRAYVERTCGRWFILSAKLGLIHPDTVIEPYDQTLNDASVGERRLWSDAVLGELREAVGDFTGLTFEIHAGANYANYGLVNGLLAGGARVEAPTAGLSLGRQLRFYAQGRGGVGGNVGTAIPADVAPVVAQVAEIIAPPSAGSAPECDARALERALEDLDRDPTIVTAGSWPGDEPGLEMPGLYSWWVDSAGAAGLSHGLGLPVVPGRIYAGQAGATRWPSGKEGKNTLGKRIGKMHLRGRVRMSTFRWTLASVLIDELGIEVTESMVITSASEHALSRWMCDHLSVAVHSTNERATLESLERRVLAALDPPLNLSHVEPSALRTRLTVVRRKISQPPTNSFRRTESKT